MPITADKIQNDIAQSLHIEPEVITGDTVLSDIGLDSLRLIMLAEQWRAEGFEVDFNHLAGLPTFSAWVDYLSSANPS